MFTSIRARILVWLLAVLLPVVAASFIATEVVERDLTDRVITDLENVRRLEAARIEAALDTYVQEAASLAAGPHVVEFTAAVSAARSGTTADGAVIAGYDGFDVVDPDQDLPLQQLTEAVQRKSRTSAAHAVEFRIVAANGDRLGETAGFSWSPDDVATTSSVLESGDPLFGEAFRTEIGHDHLALVVPVLDTASRVVGAIEMEMELAPITDFVVEHEGFGDTSEAHIAQPTSTGDAEFITLLRFERDAAFSKVVPADRGLPINQSLDAVGGTTVLAADYRGVESILSIETIEATGWGLVIKIDRAEALALVDRVQRIIRTAGAAAAAAVIAGWAVFLRPLGKRARRAAREARNVAGGAHAPIGDVIHDEIGDMARTIDRLAEDLSADRVKQLAYEEELLRRATRDELTGLVNRRHATALVAELLDRSPAVSSLLFIDLDGFKSINDTYGHMIGDEVLVGVADRLQQTAPDDSIVARWGGDEFVIVLAGAGVDEARRVAERLRAAFDHPIDTSVGPQVARWSLGASTTRAGVTLDQLLVDADHRMFEEKQARKGRHAVSSSTLREIEEALVDDRIEAHLQPIMALDVDRGDRVWGAEALVRLRRRDGTVCVPAEFLDAAQDNHLGAAIDERVASLALERLGAWQQSGIVGPDFRLAINVCEATTRDLDYPTRLSAMLARRSIVPSVLIIEVSEETRTVDVAWLDRLREMGVQIAIDDIGVGRSGLARMIDTNADVGKIDGRWTAELNADDLGRVPLAGRIADLCDRLDMTVIMEGVETEEQLDVVRSLDIRLVQGYLFSRPLPPAEFEAVWGTVARLESLVGQSS